ncbi:MAG: hypothetical protein AMJ61_13155 [Desulfobacterales bacterium SG8_35_2]|nr:MAG: hypothetical protein AMJ61_13155 [Desulfobacterales bacterium SG8_35_2]
MKKLLIPILTLFIAVYIGWSQLNRPNDSVGFTDQNNTALSIAFDERKSGFQTEGNGIVIRILPDDNDGSRHQRFILKLEYGKNLLISHNIDLAPRLSNLKKGDAVAFNGVYEWNSKGGVIHWTHHDPNGRHIPGWLKYNGKTYQ